MFTFLDFTLRIERYNGQVVQYNSHLYTKLSLPSSFTRSSLYFLESRERTLGIRLCYPCQIKQLRHTLPIRYKSFENREIVADAKFVFGSPLGNFLVAYFQKSIGKLRGILKNKSQMCKPGKRVLVQKIRKNITRLMFRAFTLRPS